MSRVQAERRVAVIGGGAAGYFAAIRCAEVSPHARVVILEATHRPLLKVLISGGGRCNVTHNCFDPAELIRAYPRGAQELRGPLSRFQPRDTIAWFEARGVRIKAESDGRMFPITDNSETIANCLHQAAREAGVEERLGMRIKEIRLVRQSAGQESKETVSRFDLYSKDGDVEQYDAVLLATGSTPSGYKMAVSLGHTITPLAPSLFTFAVKDRRLEGLSGVSVSRAHVRLHVAEKKHFEQIGAVLITHWGLSGPAVLKLSAWAARELLRANYQAGLTINWAPNLKPDDVAAEIAERRRTHPKKSVVGDALVGLPKRLYAKLAEASGIAETVTWSNITREQSQHLVQQITHADFATVGKGEFKDEFVTCGGVSLKEVDFRTMQSKLCPGLFFAGEILDIDGITGGFNFQSAWTTGWIAGNHMG